MRRVKMPYERVVRGKKQIKVDVPARVRHLIHGKSGEPVAALTEFVGDRSAATIVADFLGRIEAAQLRLRHADDQTAIRAMVA